MSLFVISLVVVASLTNMVADVFLVSGKDRDKVNQSPIEVARNTPDQHLNLSGMIGIISLALWMSVLYFLSYMKGDAGRFAMVFYAMYIGAIMVFHVICSYIFLLVKHSDMTEQKLTKLFKFYMSICIVTSLAYSGWMAYLGLSGALNMSVFHYLTLPFASTVIFQFGIGKLIRISHFESIAGTLSMLIAMLSTIHLMMTNFPI